MDTPAILDTLVRMQTESIEIPSEADAAPGPAAVESVERRLRIRVRVAGEERLSRSSPGRRVTFDSHSSEPPARWRLRRVPNAEQVARPARRLTGPPAMVLVLRASPVMSVTFS